MMQLSFAEYWPTYPAGSHSTLVLVDAEACAVDDLFILLFGCNSPFQERAREARGYTAFSESEWVADENELPSLPGGFGWTLPAPSNSHQLRGEDYQGRMRKVCFQQSGQSLRTEELHRCIRAAHGSYYIVDCTVAVTAPFGDCFRAVCRYSLVTTGPESCQLRIDYAMAYAKRMSGIARAMLEPAAESGLAKNFTQFMAVLSEQVSLTDATEPVPAPCPACPVSQSITQESDTVTSVPAPAARKGDTMAQSAAESVTALLTVAGSQRRVRSVVTVFVDDHLLDFFLPAAEVLLMSVGISTSTQNDTVRGCAIVLSTTFVLVLIQQLLNMWHHGGNWCETHSSWMLARMCASAHRTVDLPRSVTGIVVAAVSILQLRSLLGRWAGQMTDRQRARLSQEGLVAVVESPSDQNDGDAAEPPEAERDAVTPPNIHMQRLQAIGNFLVFRWDRLGGQQQQSTVDTSTVFNAGADTLLASTPAKATNSSEDVKSIGSRSVSAASKIAAASAGGSKSPSRSSSGKLSAGGKQPGILAAVKVGSSLNSGELSGKLSVDALSSHAAAGITATVEPSPLSPDHHSGQLGRESAPISNPSGATTLPVGTVAVVGHVDEPPAQVYRPAGGMVLEEVFENERWQPFRGWGHTWPGHFLPTDHVRHWCNANAQAREGGSRHRGMEFDDAAPPLPAGWIWVDDWKVDLSGRATRKCDPHGWHYGFSFLQMPFHGRSHGFRPLPCVRRRRWVRLRVLEAWGPITADMQRHLVCGKAEVCPTMLGTASSSSTPKPSASDVPHTSPGHDGLRRVGSDGGHVHRRHMSADATHRHCSGLLTKENGTSQSTPVSGLSITDVVSAPSREPSCASEPMVLSGGTQIPELASSGAGNSVQLRDRGGSGRKGCGHLRRRRTASTPAGMLRQEKSVSRDMSPTSGASSTPPIPVPSLSLTNLTRHGSTESSSGVKDRVNIRNWMFPSDDVEHTNPDLLKIYSERMYGSSVI